jgi:hypothetical protein
MPSLLELRTAPFLKQQKRDFPKESREGTKQCKKKLE